MQYLDEDEVLKEIEEITIELENKNEWTMAKKLGHIRNSLIQMWEEGMLEFGDDDQ